MEFSGTIKITDLNDFLNPSQDCSVHSSMIKTSTENTAKVSLSDCLACSGCITSAETVLLEQHSLDSLKQTLLTTPVAVSISQQSLLAISSTYNLPLDECYSLVVGALHSGGVSKVYDMCEARDIVLQAAAQEFLQKYKEGPLPLLCSECPGWVCYAEKKADSCVLPLMSKVKTPMMVQKEIKGIQEYHVAVMPCFDKKLEAAKEEGVDLVLTTTEIVTFLEELNFTSAQKAEVPCLTSSTKVKTASLGYGEYIFKQAALELYGSEPQIEVKTTRRRDLLEMECGDLKFCYSSGFQNIQNMVRQVKRGVSKYHFIEIMACPTGCLNGGGQPKITRDEIKSLEEFMGSLFTESLPRVPDLNLQREFKPLEASNMTW